MDNERIYHHNPYGILTARLLIKFEGGAHEIPFALDHLEALKKFFDEELSVYCDEEYRMQGRAFKPITVKVKYRYEKEADLTVDMVIFRGSVEIFIEKEEHLIKKYCCKYLYSGKKREKSRKMNGFSFRLK